MLNRAKKGFTLLELIVVIVILGILAALAIPTFQAVIDRAADQSAVTAAEAVGRDAVALAAFGPGERVVDFTDLEAAIDETNGAVALAAGVTALTQVDPDAVADSGDEVQTVDLVIENETVTLTLPTQPNGAVSAE